MKHVVEDGRGLRSEVEIVDLSARVREDRILCALGVVFSLQRLGIAHDAVFSRGVVSSAA